MSKRVIVYGTASEQALVQTIVELERENAALRSRCDELEAERVQFANRSKKLHRLEEENTALVKAGNELAALLRDTGNPEDDRPTWESAEDAINRWQQVRKEAQS